MLLLCMDRTAGRWRKDLEALGIIAGFYAVLMLLGITCPIKYLTGVSCMGCGMTRAWLSLLRLDFRGAVAYHPLFWLPPPFLLCYFFRDRLPKIVICGGLVAVCVLFCGVYLFRLMDGADTVVVWAPEEGLICRVWSRLAEVLAE